MFKFFKRNKTEKTEIEYRAEKKAARLKIEKEIKLSKEMAVCAEIVNIKQQLRKSAGLTI